MNADASPAALVTPAVSIAKPTRTATSRERQARCANTAEPPACGHFVTSFAKQDAAHVAGDLAHERVDACAQHTAQNEKELQRAADPASDFACTGLSELGGLRELAT